MTTAAHDDARFAASKAHPAVAPTVSVVIPTYNRLPRLRRVLEALSSQTVGPGGFEVVVVSDGATDGTDEFVTAAEMPYECLHRNPTGVRRRRATRPWQWLRPACWCFSTTMSFQAPS